MFKQKIALISVLCILCFVLWRSIADTSPPIEKDHTKHDPNKCHNLQFNLLMPTSGFVDGIQVLRGIVPIKIEMSPLFQGYGRDTGYEVFISIDYTGVFQYGSREQGGIGFTEGNILNMTYQLNTRSLNNGTHSINVNVTDHYNHFGSVLMRVIVDN
ncbi:MAG: hypothetical protein HZA10_10050 [Nitrospirae bacterium]|nr:hypothetical protein [Nitrospirota bacterium]